jgi:DNA-binding XRE family transcriptional regulator
MYRLIRDFSLTFTVLKSYKSHQEGSSMSILSLMRIGRSVKQQRVRAFITQEQLAKAAGISPRQLVRIEGNEVEPRFSTILKLGKALGVDPSELVDEE